MEATVNELQTQLSAVQAALEGNLQSGLFQLHSFNGLPNEDINEWLSRFETLAKFHGWSNAKKLNALPLSLGGPAKAWFDTQCPEAKADLTALIDGLKARFGSQSLEFLFRQELYARKQSPTEPLSLYTEDIIKKSQRLAFSDKDLMNVFINGLRDDVKNHVILNQPNSFAEAENLARLREAVSRNSGISNQLPAPQSMLQEQRIKELEHHVNLLVSLAGQNKGNMLPPISTFDQKQICTTNSSKQPATISAVDAPVTPGNINVLKNEIIAAIQSGFQNNHTGKRPRQFQPFMGNRGGARGRNLRTTDGQPICNFCRRVGHVARYCSERPQQSSCYATAPPRPPVYPGNSPSNHARSSFRPQQQSDQGTQNLNGTGPSTWGY